jgi:Cft2 family RNA processing exonuclease
VTKVRPDRTHLVTVPANGPAQEVIIIGRTLYTRQGNTWSESPAPAQPGLSLDPTAGLKAVGSQLTERPRQTLNGRQQRVFAGEASWQAGRNLNKGTLEILVDAGRKQPTRLRFAGQCGSRACSFTQTMDFSTSLAVTAPRAPRP